MAAEMFLERAEEKPTVEGEPRPDADYSDEELLNVFRACKKESFENRWIWERGWMRNIHYVNNRHWIEYVRRTNEWRDVKLAKSFPKPVTPMIAAGVMALRAMFASVNIGVNVRPNGADPKAVAVASIAEDYGPVLHEEHNMEEVMNEADFWFVVTGNSFLHTYLERSIKHGIDVIPMEMCLGCEQVLGPDELVESKGACPHCGGMELAPAGEEKLPKGKGVTIALSPFELAFPTTYARFEDVPYVIRLRWRSKTYYESHPTLKAQLKDFHWAKAPSETSLQLFRSLPYHNDMGVAPFLGGTAGSPDEEGAPEYEVTYRPCDKYPEGLVFRVLGDANPIVLRLEKDEAIPGPLPYKDANGDPLFTYEHAAFEQRGGRVYGTSPLDGAIQKQNILNQHDAFGLMSCNRMANPLWLIPKGSEIEKFTGDPGLVVKWNPLTVGGNAKPERVDGIGLGSWFFQLREQHMKDIEEALGTSDVLKGNAPSGVDSFAGMQLLVDRGQSRFASAFKARGRLYKGWFKHALEIEREFGPDERTQWILSPARSWTQKVFKTADLQGSFSIVVEEGTQTPKTALGIRAAIEHLNSLALIDPNDADQKYAIYQAFGQTKLAPSLDIHLHAALRKQQAFEEWAQSPQAQQQSLQQAERAMQEYQQQLAEMPPPPMPGAAAQVGPDGAPSPADPDAEFQAMQAALPPPPPLTKFTPLAWKPWYKPDVHLSEFLKWANGDSVVELLSTNPALEEVLTAHQEEIKAAAMQAMVDAQGPPPPGPQGAAMATQNSNRNAGTTTPGNNGNGSAG